MQFLRKFGGVTAIVLLPLFLFVFGLLFSLYQVFGSADSIKAALDKSGAYETVVQNSLGAMPVDEREDEGGAGGGIPIHDPEVQRILQDALPPELLQEQTVGFLDGFYGWLRGEQDQLQFTIDLQDAKTQLIAGLTAHAEARAGELPSCTTTTQMTRFEAADVFSADCIPPAFDRALIAQQIEREFENDEFLQDPVIAPSDFTNDEGETLEMQWANAKRAYDNFVTAVYITGVAVLLLTAGAVLLPQNWRVGLRRGAIVYITVGATGGLLVWAGVLFIQHLATNFAADNEGKVQATFGDILSYLVADVRTWWLGFSIALVAAGIGALVALRVARNKQTEQPPHNSAPSAAISEHEPTQEHTKK